MAKLESRRGGGREGSMPAGGANLLSNIWAYLKWQCQHSDAMKTTEQEKSRSTQETQGGIARAFCPSVQRDCWACISWGKWGEHILATTRIQDVSGMGMMLTNRSVVRDLLQFLYYVNVQQFKGEQILIGKKKSFKSEGKGKSAMCPSLSPHPRHSYSQSDPNFLGSRENLDFL